MNTKLLTTLVAWSLLSSFNFQPSRLCAQGTAFTYQGHLLDNSTPFTGAAEVQFTLWDALSAGTQVAASSPSTIQIGVTNGLFSTPVDFGAAPFNGSPRFLQVAARTDSGEFGTIEPRQAVTSVPYATLAFQLDGLRVERTASGSPNLIGGWAGNLVSAGVEGATIGGGGAADFVNNVSGLGGTVSGGRRNASGPVGTVGGGQNNNSSGVFASVGGGFQNTSSGSQATVGGGASNTSSGDNATVPGGSLNIAAGRNSFAAGNNARALNDGSFAWNSFLSPNLPIGPAQFGVFGFHGFNVDYFEQRPDGGGARYVYIGDLFSPLTITTWTGASLTDGGVWQNASDKNRKTEFTAVNPQAILQKLVALPLKTWRYTNETSEVRHLGPMGQDFKAAFGLGIDDKSIGTVDADGVALAAIQGLHQIVKERDTQVSRLERQNSMLEQRLAELEKLVSSPANRTETSSK